MTKRPSTELKLLLLLLLLGASLFIASGCIWWGPRGYRGHGFRGGDERGWHDGDRR